MEAARLELRGRHPGPNGEVRIPLGQTAFIDVWMDGQAESIRTLNLNLRYDPQVLAPLDADPLKEGLNPFSTGGYMPQPSEAINAVRTVEGELVYGVTNLGGAAATGSGIVASFQVKAVGPGPTTDITIDFRYPRNFTSYEIMTSQGELEKRDFQTSQVSGLHVLIGAGLLVSDIPNVMMPGGGRDRSILLDGYVLDAIYPDSQIEWSVSGATQVQVQIDENRRVTVLAPDDWSGTELLSLTARSPDGLERTDDVLVTVIGPPRLQRGLFGLPDIITDEDVLPGGLDLDDFLVSDPYNPPEDLSWFASGQQEIEVRIAPVTHQLALTPPREWSGQELILFTVSNRFGLADTTTILVSVTSINDPPVLSAFTPLTVGLGEEVQGPLIAFQVTDVDDPLDELSFAVSGNSLVTAEIRMGRIVVRGIGVGAGAVEVIARDPHGAEASDTLWVEVTGTTQAPQVAGLPDLILQAGEPFSLSLDEWVTDPDTPDSLLTWSVTSGHAVEAEIRTRGQLLLVAPEGFVGDAEVVLTVSDLQGNSAIATFSITVQGDEQELILLLPDEIELVSGQDRQFALGDVVSSPYAPLAELIWEVLGAHTVDASIDAGLLVVTALDVDARVLGELILSVADPQGNRDTDTLGVWVSPAHGPDEFAIAVPDTGMVAGGTLTMSLDPFVRVLEPSQITWEITSDLPEGFTARLDTAQRTIELGAASGFAQSVRLILRGTGPEEQVAEGAFSVAVLLPGLILADIPDLALRAGEPDTSLVLDALVLQGDPQTIAWSVQGATFIAVEVDTALHTARMSAPDGTAGEESLVFTARDRAGQTAEVEARVRVQEVWELADIPDVYLLLGEIAVLRLDQFVARGRPDRLVWTVAGARDVQVEVDAQMRLARIRAPELGPTQEELIFRAFTPAVDSLVQAVEVVVLIPPLRLLAMPDMFLTAGQVDSSRVLDLYVESGDPGTVQWAVEEVDSLVALIEPGARKLQVSALEGFAGERTLVLTATRDGENAVGSILVVVQERTPVLQIGDIPDMSLSAGQVDSSLVLDRHVEIGDPELVQWSVEGADKIHVRIDGVTRRVQLEAAEAFEEEALVFVARLEGESARDTVTVTFVEEPFRIELAGIPQMTIVQGTVDTSTVLDSFLVRGNPEVARWSIEGGILVRAAIDTTTRRLHIDARAAQAGIEVFYLEVTQAGTRASGVLRVGVKVADFAISPLPPVAIEVGQESVDVDLNPHVEGSFSPDQIRWEVRPSDHLNVSIDSLTHVLRVAPVGGFTGALELVLVAHTPLGESWQATLQVEVAGAPEGVPEITAPPPLPVNPGTVVEALDLDDLVVGEDPTVLIWRVLQQGNVRVSIDAQTHVLTLRVPGDFRGEERPRLGVRRVSGGPEAQVGLTLVATDPGLSPVLSLPEEIALPVGEVLEVDLNALVEDGDTEDVFITWSVYDDDGLDIQIDSYRGRLILFAGEYRSTPARIFLTAADPDGHQTEGVVSVRFVDVDTAGPELRLVVVGHETHADQLSIRVYADELLKRSPIVLAEGEPLAVEEQGDHYRAVYAPSREGVLSIAASGVDLRDNEAYVSLPVTLRWLSQTGTTVFSPDETLQVNVAEVIGGPLAALVYAVMDEEMAYFVDILGVGQPRQAAGIIFVGVEPGEADDLVIMRRHLAGVTWEELATYAEDGTLYASAIQMGVFRTAMSEAGSQAEAPSGLAFPNPFNTEVAIRYVVQDAGHVRVEIYDLQGHRVRVLIDRTQGGGPWAAVWDGQNGRGVNMASGVYLYVVHTAGERRTGKMTLLR